MFTTDSHPQRTNGDPAGRLSSVRPESLSQRQGQCVIGASREEREYARCVMGGELS